MIHRLLSVLNESSLAFENQAVGENVVLILRRHYFTLMVPLGFLLLLTLIPMVLWYLFTPQFEDWKITTLFFFISSLWYMWLWALSFYYVTMYLFNMVIVTDRRIIENEQRGFFNRKISELHTYRVQDITVQTNGLIETFLNFGDLDVQTAASEKQFVFHKIANPEKVKDAIMRTVISHRSHLKLS